MNYAAFKYGGVMWLVFTLDPKNINRATNETINFLKKTREQNYSRGEYPGEDQRYVFDYLRAPKNQIKFNVQQAQERGLNLAASLARHMLLTRGGFETGYLKNIEKLSSLGPESHRGEISRQRRICCRFDHAPEEELVLPAGAWRSASEAACAWGCFRSSFLFSLHRLP